jgi:hypothetical protein
MEILSFDKSAQPARKKKSLGLILGVALIAGVTTLGSTLAASVTIGSSPITFGQGLTQAVACDSAITVTPATEFVNASGAGSFRLKTVTIGGLDNSATNASTGVGCGGKNLIIRAYGDSSSTPLTLWSGSTSITAAVNATIASTTVNSGASVTTSANTLVITITTPTVSAADIFKITVEQQN